MTASAGRNVGAVVERPLLIPQRSVSVNQPGSARAPRAPATAAELTVPYGTGLTCICA
ncbi:hypothetical protein L798_05679 [Zootermopsis nevadensis]|uniref:Uncharacterized protein n=1 Tax=Zootermopsis nevadensis TaxID=136037 RepID=A0A067RBH3_ZOONE|nr:hypothetical protein L798_05679 [Zootermopsis nevadensis]